MKKVHNINPNFIEKINGLQRLLFSLVFSVSIYFLLSLFDIDMINRILLSWDSFCIAMIIASWILFFTTTAEELCDVVERQDDGLKVIFAIVLIAVFFSVLGTLILLSHNSLSSLDKAFHTIVSLSPVVFSWILLHTIFAIRYAHLYHDHNELNTGSNVGGIEFPSKMQPDYVDFAYFSFIIGMTFQVSDVSVSSRVIRRFVLMHSVISFFFNTIIIALTINTVAGLKG